MYLFEQNEKSKANETGYLQNKEENRVERTERMREKKSRFSENTFFSTGLIFRNLSVFHILKKREERKSTRTGKPKLTINRRK